MTRGHDRLRWAAGPVAESLMAQPVRLTVWASAAVATVLIMRVRGWREAPAASVRPG
ncbi:hypothetical protein [Micromonospora sp. NPDC023956]|uniref:hypothetical protein n=1 Tax=Micromonospora sp. NPDC023956 TaxID=3155722 RepID=UPI0033F7006D